MLSHQNPQCQSLTLIRAWRFFGDHEVNLCASSLLARYKRPTVLHLVDALPRNASGKVMTTSLRREYG